MGGAVGGAVGVFAVGEAWGVVFLGLLGGWSAFARLTGALVAPGVVGADVMAAGVAGTGAARRDRRRRGDRAPPGWVGAVGVIGLIMVGMRAVGVAVVVAVVAVVVGRGTRG